MPELDGDIIVCRCEDVTLEEIRKVIREGATTMDEIRRTTRAGMGPCQGRTCRLLIASELARALGKSVTEILPSTCRPPSKAVQMGDLERAAFPTDQSDIEESSKEQESTSNKVKAAEVKGS